MTTFRKASIAAVAIALVDVAWLTTGFGGPRATQTFSNLAASAVPLAAAVACALRAGRPRRPWMLLSASAASWGAGQCIWTYYELVVRRDVPFPSFADVGYLAAVPLGAAALLSFPSAPARIASRIRTLLDGLIIAGSLLFVSWATVLGPMYRAASEGLLERVIGLAYPAGDVVIAAIVVFVMARARTGRAPLLLLGSGMVALALSDSGFAYLTLHEAYATGGLVDAGWLIGYLLIGLAALRPDPSSAEAVESKPRLGGALIPYAAVVMAVGVGAFEQVRTGRLGPFLFWNMLAVVGAVVARQLAALLDNLYLNRNLEAIVRVRTSELEAALCELNEAQRLQENFVANVSHELRTPLTTILAASDVLLRKEMSLDPQARTLVEAAHRGASRMTVLVEDLLRASGSDARAVRLGPVNISAELSETLTAFSPKGKHVAASIPRTLVALADAAALRLVVADLLSNAEKFAPDGTTIRLEASRDGHAVHIDVLDEGPGVPDELRHKVFDRFYQADGGSTRTAGGVGLGLFLARGLAEEMGGSLTIVDGEQGGAFRLSLKTVEVEGATLRARRREPVSAPV